MITVDIKINGETLFSRSAWRIQEPNDEGKARYKVDTGKFISHKPEDGAVKLVQKMLKTIKEVDKIDNHLVSQILAKVREK